MYSKQKVEIVNPVAPVFFIRRSQAEKHVATGRAKWDSIGRLEWLRPDDATARLSVSQKPADNRVKIVNPVAPVFHIRRSQALEHVAAGRAEFDSIGRLKWLRTDQAAVDRKRKGGALQPITVREFCGRDAFPGRAVMPPSPSVLAAQRGYRGPVVPPLRKIA